MPGRLDRPSPQFRRRRRRRQLTRAGERLRLSQPTISLQVKRLERSLGHRLLERNPHGVRLTRGETLLAYAAASWPCRRKHWRA
jgi:DNA-binding transcriptional LysR family regulator